MAEIGLAVAQTLFAALNCSELKQICAVWGYQSQLEDLRKTVNTIKNVLKDAESKVLTHEAQGYVDELKDALYEADDLFDEFVTLLELNQLQQSPSKLAEFKHKVRRFFSSNQNQVSHAYRMFHGVKKIQKKLNAIVDNHKKFSLGVDYEPICMRREDTCSYVDVKDIIGRDHDKNTIIDKLLESKDQHVQFLTIVGVGGLGKTALAQLVYNDERLKHEFGDFMFWVCVSDQDKAQFEVKAILCKILELIRIIYDDKQYVAPTTKEEAQKLFREKIRGKKFLLVLDDLWNEDREKWVGLETLLKLGQGGSRVLITTRSDLTATSVGSEWTHVLQGLSLDHSWKLFEMTVFDKGINQQSMNHTEMVEIGKKIIEKCNNIPLAIKVVGSLLFRQDLSKWRSFEKSELTNIDYSDKKIMSVLKFSYHNLRSSLKSCFAYCAVFPKDFVIEKGWLINLWMAQGYIVPLNEGQRVEDVAEENFKILLRRCFFQDVKRDAYGEIKSVKIHDLMHDVAQEVGGEEFQVLSSDVKTFGDRTRHVTIFDNHCFANFSNWSNLRTILIVDLAIHCYDIIPRCAKVVELKSLRVLELKYLYRGSSLNSIDKLQHLRYLNLSHGGFEELPNSITKLHNLKTLILYKCGRLRHLPHDLCKLVKLSHLNLDYCWELTGMPLGLDKLTGLRLLTDFVVGKKKNIITEKQSDDELKDLGALTNLTGGICIDIDENYRNVDVMKDMSRGYLSKIPGLKEVTIVIREKCVEAEAEVALEKLEPHPNLKKLKLYNYGGRTISWWRRVKNNSPTIKQLSNLVYIKIGTCENLVNLPSFSKLPFLKTLKLYELENLEYMEIRSSLPNNSKFFPSLETLNIRDCPKWKGGWFRKEGSGDVHYGSRGILSFPCLSTLEIMDCNEMTSFPPCPSVKTIFLRNVNKTSRLMKKMMGKEEKEQEQQGEVTVCNHTSSSSSSCLVDLSIMDDGMLERLLEYEKVFKMCASSLRRLQIMSCRNLGRLSRGLEHLTALESLYIGYSRRLKFFNILAWKLLDKTLHSLTFFDLGSLKSLPKGMQHLTSLQTLVLANCRKLKGLPEWISCLLSLQSLTIDRCDCIDSLPKGIQTLTSLQTLKIKYCPALIERCSEPDGEDWPKIQHIPNKQLI